MSQLEYLANVADIFSGVVVIGGLIFGLLQLRHFEHERRQRVAFELVHSFQSPEFTRALRAIFRLKDSGGPTDFRAAGPEYEEAAFQVALTLENVGLMVYRRIAPLEMVLQLMRGSILTSWQILMPWVVALREETGRDSIGEWFEWIAEQADARSNDAGDRPAYEAYRDWKPR